MITIYLIVYKLTMVFTIYIDVCVVMAVSLKVDHKWSLMALFYVIVCPLSPHFIWLSAHSHDIEVRTNRILYYFYNTTPHYNIL